MQRANAVGGSPLYTHGLGYAYAAAGNKTRARAVIDVLKQRAEQTYHATYFIAAWTVTRLLSSPTQPPLMRPPESRGPRERSSGIKQTVKTYGKGATLRSTSRLGTYRTSRSIGWFPPKLSVAVRRLYGIHAAGFELRGELDDPVAFWEHRGPPNDGNVITGISDHVYSSRCLDEGAPGCQFLRRAVARTNEMPLSESAPRENDVAHGLVEMPGNHISGFHRECLNLDRARYRKARTVSAKVIIGNGSYFERDARQRQRRTGQQDHETDNCQEFSSSICHLSLLECVLRGEA